MADRPVAVLVVGMHRSGTSAVTRVLNLCGAYIGSYLLPPSVDNNEKGFWEHVEVVDIHHRLLASLGMTWDDQRQLPHGWIASSGADWARTKLGELIDREFSGKPLWAVKDPRICRFIPLWLEVLQSRAIDVRLLFVLRDPREVAASLAKRDGLLPAETQMLSLHHFFEASAASVSCVRSVITYPQLLKDWSGCIRRVATEMGVSLAPPGPAVAKEIDGFLDTSDRHHSIDSAPTDNSLLGRVYRCANEAVGSEQFWAMATSLQAAYQSLCDEALPLVEVLYGLNRETPGTDVVADLAREQSDRMRFRIVRGLQVNVERLGQASADLGQMIRLGSEATYGLKVDFARFSSQLDKVVESLAHVEAMRTELADALRASTTQMGELREAQAQLVEELAGGQERAFAQLRGDLQSAVASLREAHNATMQSSTQSFERGQAELKELLSQVIARNEQLDRARFSQKLRRLFRRG